MRYETVQVNVEQNIWPKAEDLPDGPANIINWCRVFDQNGSVIEFYVDHHGITMRDFYKSLFDGQMPSRTMIRKRMERKQHCVMLFCLEA